MEFILISAAAFFAGWYVGRRTAKPAEKDIYEKEYGLKNGLMAPKKRK